MRPEAKYVAVRNVTDTETFSQRIDYLEKDIGKNTTDLSKNYSLFKILNIVYILIDTIIKRHFQFYGHIVLLGESSIRPVIKENNVATVFTGLEIINISEIQIGLFDTKAT